MRPLTFLFIPKGGLHEALYAGVPAPYWAPPTPFPLEPPIPLSYPPPRSLAAARRRTNGALCLVREQKPALMWGVTLMHVNYKMNSGAPDAREFDVNRVFFPDAWQCVSHRREHRGVGDALGVWKERKKENTQPKGGMGERHAATLLDFKCGPEVTAGTKFSFSRRTTAAGRRYSQPCFRRYLGRCTSSSSSASLPCC